MNKYKKMQYKLIAKEMVDILNEKGYISYYAEDKEEAAVTVDNIAKENKKIELS